MLKDLGRVGIFGRVISRDVVGLVVALAPYQQVLDVIVLAKVNMGMII